MSTKSNIPRGLKNKLITLWPLEAQLEQLKTIHPCTREIGDQIMELMHVCMAISMALDMGKDAFNDICCDKKEKDKKDNRFVDITKQDLIKLIKDNVPTVAKITQVEQQIMQDDGARYISILSCEVPNSANKKYIFSIELDDLNGVNCKNLLKQVYLLGYEAPNVRNEFCTQVFDIVWDYNRTQVEKMMDDKIAFLSNLTQDLNPMDKQIYYFQLTLKSLLEAREKDADKKYVGTQFVDARLDTLQNLYNELSNFEVTRMGFAKNVDVSDSARLEFFREDCKSKLDRLTRMRQAVFKEFDDESTDNDSPTL